MLMMFKNLTFMRNS